MTPTEAIDVLRQLEWCRWDKNTARSYCHICNAYQEDGHKRGCRLLLLIADCTVDCARINEQAPHQFVGYTGQHAPAKAFEQKPLPFGLDMLCIAQLSRMLNVSPCFDGWTLKGACKYLCNCAGGYPPGLREEEMGPVPEGTPGRLPVGTITNPIVQIQPCMTLGEALTMLCRDFEGV